MKLFYAFLNVSVQVVVFLLVIFAVNLIVELFKTKKGQAIASASIAIIFFLLAVIAQYAKS